MINDRIFAYDYLLFVYSLLWNICSNLLLVNLVIKVKKKKRTGNFLVGGIFQKIPLFPEILLDSTCIKLPNQARKMPYCLSHRSSLESFPYTKGKFPKPKLILPSPKSKCLVCASHCLKALQTWACRTPPTSLTVGGIIILILQRLRPTDHSWLARGTQRQTWTQTLVSLTPEWYF